MKKLTKSIVALHCIFQFAYANEYALITTNHINTISKAQIKAIYLKKLTYLNNMKIIPINLEANNKIRKSFNKHILHMSFNRLEIYWIKQHYLGHRPPLSMKSQKSIKSFLKKVNGAIGYIEVKNMDSSFKVLYRWSD
ncbi:hypothetical protein [Sulfurimonas sp.]